MNNFEQPLVNPVNPEISKPLKFSDLDVKGREIFGLEPKPENFSQLKSGKDFKIIHKNKNIESNQNLDDCFLFVNPTGGTEERIIQAPHWRTISTENIRASYENGKDKQFYYTANTKGAGYLKPRLKGKDFNGYKEWKRVDEHGIKGAYGMAAAEDFLNDEGNLVDVSRFLTEQGLRTELYYEVAELKNAYYQGKLTPIEDLRKKNVITKKDFTPSIGLRLLKINTRIAEVKESDDKRTGELFKHAFDVFNKENEDKKLGFPKLTIGDQESEKIYFEEFFKRMGKNMAVFQNVGYIGWAMHSANITLAAEIVDIASYESWKHLDDDPKFVKKYNGVRRGVLKDIRDVAYDLKFLIKAGKRIGLAVPAKEDLLKFYLESFSSNLDLKKLADEEDVDAVKLQEAIRKVSEAVLVQKKDLPPLKSGYDIKDWDI